LKEISNYTIGNIADQNNDNNVKNTVENENLMCIEDNNALFE